MHAIGPVNRPMPTPTMTVHQVGNLIGRTVIQNLIAFHWLAGRAETSINQSINFVLAIMRPSSSVTVD